MDYRNRLPLIAIHFETVLEVDEKQNENIRLNTASIRAESTVFKTYVIVLY